MLKNILRRSTPYFWAIALALSFNTARAAEESLEVPAFKPGKQHRQIKARIKGRETVDYIFQAGQNQKLSVVLKSGHRALYFNLLTQGNAEALFFGPGAIDPGHLDMPLPETGEYRIRLYLMRSAARRNETATYTLSIQLSGEAHQETPAPTGFPTRLEQNPQPFDAKLALAGIRFHITCTNEGSINQLQIIPSGLKIDNTPIRREIDGSCTGAEVSDLNADGSPEVYVYINSAGSGSYGTLVAFSANRRQSLSEIFLPPLEQNPQAAGGYMGHDEFAVMEGILARRFPVYRESDTQGKPSGGMRQMQYKLLPGEASWQLKLEQIVEY